MTKLLCDKIIGILIFFINAWYFFFISYHIISYFSFLFIFYHISVFRC